MQCQAFPLYLLATSAIPILRSKLSACAKTLCTRPRAPVVPFFATSEMHLWTKPSLLQSPSAQPNSAFADPYAQKRILSCGLFWAPASPGLLSRHRTSASTVHICELAGVNKPLHLQPLSNFSQTAHANTRLLLWSCTCDQTSVGAMAPVICSNTNPPKSKFQSDSHLNHSRGSPRPCPNIPTGS